MSTTAAPAADAPPTARPVYNRIVFVLSLLGAIVAGALWYWHAHPVDIPCGASGGCETVAQSPYAEFPTGSGIPVALYGALGYIALAALSFLRTLPGSAGRDRLLLGLIILGSTLGTLFSLRLTYLELYVIHAICRWCMTSQALILGIALVSGAEWLRRGSAAAAAAATATPNDTPSETAH